MFLLEKEITCFGNFAKFVVFIRSSFLVLCIYSFSWLRAVKYNIKDRCNTHCILEIFIQWSINFELLSILYIPVHSKENIFKVGIKKLTFLKYSTIASDVVSLWSSPLALVFDVSPLNPHGSPTSATTIPLSLLSFLLKNQYYDNMIL